MKNQFRGFFMTVFLLGALFLVGCSENSNKKPTKENEGSSAQRTLVFGRGGDSTSLDPSRVTEGETFKVTVNIYETLLNFAEKDTNIQPGLAESWSTSEDGLTYTFNLREGVKFHDGTNFNAEAVVKNFDRWANGNAEKFPYYNSMFGGFKGDEGHVIESVTATDEHTVVIQLKRPQAPFLKNIAMSMFAIASPKAFEKGEDEFERNPVGTGPFQFVEWKVNDTITIEKFDDYWQEGLPKLDQIVFQSIPDNTARLNALIAGDIDLADGINPADSEKIEANENLQLLERPSMNIGYLGMTVTRPPFDKKEVRQAMNYAIDRQTIINSFFEGRAELAKNPMPSSVPGYNHAIEPYEYNPEKAKELLAQAGFADGFDMELWAMPVPRPYMPDGEKVAEVIQSNLADIGIRAKIVSYEWATYLDKASKGEADAFLLGWTGDNGDADNFLYVLLDEDNIGSNNYTHFKNDEMHDLLIKAQTEIDEKKRNEYYQQVQEIIHEESPWVPIAHSTPLLGAVKELKGLVPHPTGSDVLMHVEFKE